MLEREEYIEQAWLFRTLSERQSDNVPIQELMYQIKDEVLATTRLPFALDFLVTEVKHSGTFSPAMARLEHYFTPFQTYLIGEAEYEGGRFDMRMAIEILRYEAEYRAKGVSPPGLFLYQFESLCRNRLKYERGLEAMARDPLYNADWREWIQIVRRQVGLVDFSTLLYVRSEYYGIMRERQGLDPEEVVVLFGEKEGKIAWAHRNKDPLYLFAALQRHLGYPAVPRPQKPDTTKEVIPQLLRRMERLEVRLKILEEENREGAFDVTRFYEKRPPS